MEEKLIRLDLIQKDIERKESEAFKEGKERGMSEGVLFGAFLGVSFWIVLEILITFFQSI